MQIINNISFITDNASDPPIQYNSNQVNTTIRQNIKPIIQKDLPAKCFTLPMQWRCCKKDFKNRVCCLIAICFCAM